MINKSALKNVLNNMQRNGIDENTAEELYHFFISSTPDRLVNMNPNYIAAQCGIGRFEILNAVIQGITNSLFEMNWDINCTLCHDVVGQTKLLAGIKHTAHCERCETDFDNFADENITVSVSLHPSLFEKPPVISTQHKITDSKSEPLRALELVGLPAFKQNFSSQLPDLDESIKIRSITVLFTDLIKSTHLYSAIGDLEAYALIREHFNVLFEKIISSSGGIIKTLGDAVLAFFPDPFTAVNVSFELKETVKDLFAGRELQEEFGLRIGINQGPALIVNFNESMDVFGTTINLASRIVNFADEDSIALAPHILREKELTDHLKKQGFEIRTFQQDIKGIPEIKTINLISHKERKIS